MNASLSLRIVPALILLALLVPVLSHAQQDSDLQATIRSALSTDPRTAGMSKAQVDAMVDALSQKAATQGVTSQDITWRPQTPSFSATAPADTCGPSPSFLCRLNVAFGFDGSDIRIPWGLGLSSLALMFILAALLERHHLQTLAARAAPVRRV